MTTPVLEIVDVVRRYGSPPTVALDGVSLRIDPGEMLAVVGPSGSGKSTLLGLMGTLDRPTSGQVFLNGNDVSQLRDRQLSGLRAHSVGFVFQSFHLSDTVTARENVANGLLYAGVPRGERRARATVALERVGLSHRCDHLPRDLSGGEKQRVAIARAIVGSPSVVLADEPTGALDTRTGATIMSILRELNDAGTTVVVITHDTQIAAALPRQVKIRDGQIECDSAREPQGGTA